MITFTGPSGARGRPNSELDGAAGDGELSYRAHEGAQAQVGFSKTSKLLCLQPFRLLFILATYSYAIGTSMFTKQEIF